MAKVSQVSREAGERLVVICDVSPPRGPDPHFTAQFVDLEADFLSVAYNPNKSVRVDSVALAHLLREEAGREVVFNLATRDMNRLAVQSHLLGASMLGLQNVLVVRGDEFSERDLQRTRPVHDYRPTELMEAIRALNQGYDYRGLRLRWPTDFCVGTVADPSRGLEREVRLLRKKLQAGAEFVLTQPVYDPAVALAFLEEYRRQAGEPIPCPVFFGLQVLQQGGILFGPVPEATVAELEGGRSGTAIALDLLERFLVAGIRRVYLIPPILPKGVRNYEAARQVLAEARRVWA